MVVTYRQARFAVLSSEENLQMVAPKVVPELRRTVVLRRPLETLRTPLATNESGALLRKVLPDLRNISPCSACRSLRGCHRWSRIREMLRFSRIFNEQAKAQEESWPFIMLMAAVVGSQTFQDLCPAIFRHNVLQVHRRLGSLTRRALALHFVVCNCLFLHGH